MPDSNSYSSAAPVVNIADIGAVIFESSNDCVKVLDPDGLLLSMNKNGQCVMEIDDFRSVAGHAWASLWPPESGGAIKHALAEARAGRTGHFEAFCPTAKSTPKWWDVIVSPVLGADGGIEKILSISRDITDVRRANDELHASRERFSLLLESSSEGIYGIGPDHICTFINSAGARMLGYDSSELIGRQLHALIHHHHADGSAYPWEACRLGLAVTSGIAARIEDEVFWHKDGRAIPVSYSVAPLQGAGSNAGAVVTFADITERKQTQKALQASADRLRVATDAAELGLWTWEPESGDVTWENARGYEILGLPASSGPVNANRFAADFLHPDDIARFQHAVSVTLAEDRRFKFEGRMLGDDGNERWVELYGRSQQRPDAGAYLVGTIADITIRKRAEEALFESRQSLEKIITQAATGVLQLDVTGRVTLANQKFCDMLGYAESELLGMSVVEMTAPQFVETTRRALTDLAAGAPPVVIEKQYARKDGSLLWATSSVNALRGLDGAFLGLVAIVVDVSERKAAEEKLRDADRRKDEFLAMLAHELRNPLAPIGAAAELLKMGKSDAARVRQTSEIISRQVSHMTNLVDDLLDVSRVTRGLVTLDKVALDMRHIINDAVEQAGPLIRKKRHELALHLTPGVTTVMGDNKRLVQIVSNLLNNAAKYTPAGGAIVLRTEVDAEMVHLTVSDNGIGIDEQLASRVFDLFTQAEHTPDRSSGGLGLGLALVKNLVELHGGSVSCASAGAGHGSTFRVALPRLVAASVPAGETVGTGALGGQPARRVLLVDDNVDGAMMLGMLLEASGHTVTVVHSAAMALASVEQQTYDVCLLDIGLPEMDGNELARRLRLHPRASGSMLVAITGYGQETDRQNTTAAGFDHHLIKPVDSHKLLALLSGAS